MKVDLASEKDIRFFFFFFLFFFCVWKKKLFSFQFFLCLLIYYNINLMNYICRQIIDKHRKGIYAFFNQNKF